MHPLVIKQDTDIEHNYWNFFWKRKPKVMEGLTKQNGLYRFRNFISILSTIPCHLQKSKLHIYTDSKPFDAKIYVRSSTTRRHKRGKAAYFWRSQCHASLKIQDFLTKNFPIWKEVPQSFSAQKVSNNQPTTIFEPHPTEWILVNKNPLINSLPENHKTS